MGGTICRAVCGRLRDDGDALDALSKARRRAAADLASVDVEPVASAGRAAMDQLLRLSELDEGCFVDIGNHRGVDLWRLRAEDGLQIIRGRIRLRTGSGPEGVVSAALDYALRPRWDTHFLQGGIVLSDLALPAGGAEEERLSVVWEAASMPDPTVDRGRDFVQARLVRHLQDGRVASASRSLDIPGALGVTPISLPQSLKQGALIEGLVRAYAYLIGFLASESDDGEVSLTYMCELDLRGSSSSTTMDDFMEEQAHCLASLATILTGNGAATSADSPAATPREAVSPNFYNSRHEGEDIMDLVTRVTSASLQAQQFNGTPSPAPTGAELTLPITAAGAATAAAMTSASPREVQRARSHSSFTRQTSYTSERRSSSHSSTRTWQNMVPMGTQRSNLAAAVVGGHLFACGGLSGSTSSSSRLSSVELFDSHTLTWIAAAPMLTHRSSLGAAALGDSLYVCGGWSSSSKLSSVERFDIGTGTWSLTSSMSAERCGLAVAVLDNVLYACGGFDSSRNLASVERYDPRVGVWSLTTPMGQRRFSFATAVLDNMLYACGGSDGPTHLETVEVFDPRMEVWASVAPMNAARSGHALAAFEGALYACGGRNRSAPALTEVERFDQHTRTWSPTFPMNIARNGLAVATLGTAFYACGGKSASCERFGNIRS